MLGIHALITITKQINICVIINHHYFKYVGYIVSMSRARLLHKQTCTLTGTKKLMKLECEPKHKSGHIYKSNEHKFSSFDISAVC